MKRKHEIRLATVAQATSDQTREEVAVPSAAGQLIGAVILVLFANSLLPFFDIAGRVRWGKSMFFRGANKRS